MNSLQKEFTEQVDFLGVYISEAHAKDEWPLGVKYCFDQPKTIEERINVATGFVHEYKFELPMLIDTMKNEFDFIFSSWPERFYIVQNNVLALVGEPTTEFGFDREILRTQLRSLLAAKTENGPAQ